MVNTRSQVHHRPLTGISRLVAVYVLVVVATIAALAVLARVQPDQASHDAWIHAAIVAVFAVLLPVRLRSARRGNVRARRVVGVIAAVLVAVNVIEAAIPGLFPLWMRIEMIGIAVIMTGIGPAELAGPAILTTPRSESSTTMAHPPRRRQRLGADERREQIMSAAVVVLAEYGYQGASADAIAQHAGVSKGLLWHYFAGRDDLMEQTAKRTLIILRRAVGELIDLTAPAPEVIRAAILGAATIRSTHGAERRAMQEIIINLRTADGTSRLTLRDYEDTYAAQEEIFRRGQDAGEFRPTLDPRVLAVTYQGAVDALLGYLDTHPDVDPDTYVEAVADVLLTGIEQAG